MTENKTNQLVATTEQEVLLQNLYKRVSVHEIEDPCLRSREETE